LPWAGGCEIWAGLHKEPDVVADMRLFSLGLV
jgi:hypothetical protein